MHVKMEALSQDDDVVIHIATDLTTTSTQNDNNSSSGGGDGTCISGFKEVVTSIEKTNHSESSTTKQQQQVVVTTHDDDDDANHRHQGVATKKRKRERIDHYANAYDNTQYELIPTQPQVIQIPGVPDSIHLSCLPGTPQRQFAHSFQASFHTTTTMTRKNNGMDADHHQQDQCHHQIIHQHANGLAIVTAGTLCRNYTPHDIQAIDFLVAAAHPCSAGERRKRQSKMLKKGKVNHGTNTTTNTNNKKNSGDRNHHHQQHESNSHSNNEKKKDATTTQQQHDDDDATVSSGVVTPSTQIARITLRDGTILPLHALVWGAILEVNTNITPEQLTQDPLLDGYLAIVLPTGPFPPNNAKCKDDTDDSKKKEHKKDNKDQRQQQDVPVSY
jgi:hypothetical protein